MKAFTAVAALVAGANAYAYGYAPQNTTSVAPSSSVYESKPPVYQTTTVSSYTTVCPGPTTIPINPSSTITVTKATTLTITDCPCTITYPVETPAVPTTYKPAPPAPVYPTNGTAPAPPAPTGTAPGASSTPTAPATPEFPGSAAKAGLSIVAVGGALLALF
jgi:hypothetical protein